LDANIHTQRIEGKVTFRVKIHSLYNLGTWAHAKNRFRMQKGSKIEGYLNGALAEYRYSTFIISV
jgi:hypothetical protein